MWDLTTRKKGFVIAHAHRASSFATPVPPSYQERAASPSDQDSPVHSEGRETYRRRRRDPFPASWPAERRGTGTLELCLAVSPHEGIARQFLGSDLEDESIGSRTNECIAVRKTLSSRHDCCIEIGALVRSVAP